MTMEAVEKLISQMVGYEGTASDMAYLLRKGRRTNYLHGGDAAGSTEYTIVFHKCEKQLNIDAAEVIPQDALTADNTDFATISIGYADGAGGTVTKIASITTEELASGGTGDWVAETALPIDLAGATVTVAAGKYLVLEVEKAASGVDCPAYVLDVEYSYV